MRQGKRSKTHLVSAQDLERLAIFPLPETVFFPNTILPLHIFEPRYRAMVRDALRDEFPIAVVLLEPGDERDEAGRPRVHGVAGLGVIIDHHELPDGRFNILLQGLGRVRFLRELPTVQPYRQVHADWLDEAHADPTQATAFLTTLRNCIFTLSRQHRRIGGPLVRMASQVPDPEALVDVLSSILFPEVEIRQELLEEGDFDRRYARILSRLSELLGQTGTPSVTN